MLTSTTLNQNTRRRLLSALGCAAVATSWCIGAASAAQPVASHKHYFKVVAVEGEVPESARTLARQLLEKELSNREQFTNDLDGVEASSETLKSRGMRAFEISLRFLSNAKNVDEPKAGKRGKQLTVGTRISVVGSEIPDKRLAFSGEGESTQIAEVDERRIEKEAQLMMSEVLGDAIRQAVDQAVLKLSAASSRRAEAGPKKRRTKKAN